MKCGRLFLFLLPLIVLLPRVGFSVDSLSHISPKSHALVTPKISKGKRSFESLLLDQQIATQVASTDFFLGDYALPLTDAQQDIRDKIEATFNKVEQENRFIEFLDLTAMIELPVGIRTDLGVLRYTILIDSIVMTPKESFLYASMMFETPQGKHIHFMGSDIKFSKTGGLTGDGKLMLVGDYPIKLDGDNTQLIIKGSDKKTFVEFDCHGYKQLSLDASLMFSRNLLLPEGANGSIQPEGNVAVSFTTTVTDWDDILVDVSIPKFQVKGVKDVTFSVNNAVLDFSDTRNAASVKFPDGYAQMSPQLMDGNLNLWKGVYIRDVTVTLPPQFEKNEGAQNTPANANRISITGTNLIIDHVGFSGRIAANNLIPIDKGKIGNWDFSLETIYVTIVANELTEGGFNGKVNIPLNKSESAQPATAGTQQAANANSNLFSYTAVIKTGNEYLFTVQNAGKVNFNLWKAEVTLNPSSYVEIRLSEGKFLPKAHLNGQMTMNLGMQNGDASADKNKNVKIAKVTFEGLEIQTVKPYVKVGSFSLGREGGDSGAGGFPIRVNQISGSSSGNTITLGIDLTLSLIGESDGGFAANGKFNIVAESNENGRSLSYRFKEIQFERFGIDIDKGAFKFKGTLNIYKEDPVYGNGISGTVDATFNPGIRLQASVIFGTLNGKRYWFADAMAEFKSGITVFPGFAFYGFGGGAYYHMKIDDKGVGSALGKTVSGMVYVPDETVGFGFKATVSLGVQPGEKAFNGDATFEMAFNTGGGLRYINFRGNGYFMSTPMPGGVEKLKAKTAKLASVAKKLGSTNLNEGSSAAAEEIHGSAAEAGDRAQVWASLMINYDFDNHILHGNLSAYINVAGGLIKGGGPNGRAGEAVLHFAPGEWYIYIGRPEYENRFAIEVLNIARLDAYFVIGTVIPDSPPPPDNVSSILGGIDLDYMKELNALGDGAGVGFGASFRVDTGDMTFLMFYGRFAAGLGFDLMLKNYGDASCVGGGRLGINGWYANGQAYAYFEGNIGIKVKIFGKSKKISILEVGAAVVAQAMLPNPTWVRGIAGGHFSVLGGLVKGNCKFEIEIGKKCEIVRKKDDGSVLETVDVIAQLTPADNAQQVDVFTLPQAVFNYEMEKEYEMVDDQEQVVKFKITLDEIAVKDAGTPVKADVTWNDDKTVAALNPFEILPSEKNLSFDVTTSFKEYKGGTWMTTIVNGQKLSEKQSVAFRTGLAPPYIEPGNVAFSYPTKNQFNYYKNEYGTGYITLTQGQSYLFSNTTDWSYFVRFKTRAGQQTDVPVTYIKDAKEVRFSMPQSLANDQIYSLDVVSLPKAAKGTVDSNVDTHNRVVATSDPEMNLDIKTKSAKGTISEGQEKNLYASYFRSSKYNTLREKVQSTNPSEGWRDPIVPGVHAIGVNFGGNEPFSYEEILGSDKNSPLIQLEADLTNVPWYQNKVFPLVYQNYPVEGAITISAQNRDPAVLGVIPTKAVYLYQHPYDYALKEADTESGVITLSSAIGRFDYYLAYFMYNDFQDFSRQAANYAYLKGGNARLNDLIAGRFPVIQKGDYWINIKYVLPGKNTVSSTYRNKIFNPID
jgi:hypothetical protein